MIAGFDFVLALVLVLVLKNEHSIHVRLALLFVLALPVLLFVLALLMLLFVLALLMLLFVLALLRSLPSQDRGGKADCCWQISCLSRMPFRASSLVIELSAWRPDRRPDRRPL